MNNELLLEYTRTTPKQHGKNANDNSLTDLVKILNMAYTVSGSNV